MKDFYLFYENDKRSELRSLKSILEEIEKRNSRQIKYGNTNTYNQEVINNSKGVDNDQETR